MQVPYFYIHRFGPEAGGTLALLEPQRLEVEMGRLTPHDHRAGLICRKDVDPESRHTDRSFDGKISGNEMGADEAKTEPKQTPSDPVQAPADGARGLLRCRSFRPGFDLSFASANAQ